MLKIVARSKVKKECQAEYLNTIKELVQKSQAEEGNISYTVNRQKDDPDVFAFIEVWRDQEAFEYHVKTEHFTTILPKLAPYVEQSLPAEFYTEVEF